MSSPHFCNHAKVGAFVGNADCFLTAGACVGIAIRVRIESTIGSAPPWLFCSAICRSKLSSQNPFELRVF